MRRVERDEILDYETYEEQREEIRAAAIATKELRRVDVAGHLTFLFENHDTVRYQVLEMVRAERLVREADIRHELDTYNELLGEPGDLGCTLLIGIPDPKLRDVKLREWKGLLDGLWVELEDGTRVAPIHDERQVDDDRLSAVQFLRFPTGGRVPVAVVSDHADVKGRTPLSEATRTALAADLATGA